MTRSTKHNKEVSRHMHPAENIIKKSGHGRVNWGGQKDEIEDGLNMYQSGIKLPGAVSMAELGMSKLSTSPSSASSNGSDAASTASGSPVFGSMSFSQALVAEEKAAAMKKE